MDAYNCEEILLSQQRYVLNFTSCWKELQRGVEPYCLDSCPWLPDAYMVQDLVCQIDASILSYKCTIRFLLAKCVGFYSSLEFPRILLKPILANLGSLTDYSSRIRKHQPENNFTSPGEVLFLVIWYKGALLGLILQKLKISVIHIALQ